MKEFYWPLLALLLAAGAALAHEDMILTVKEDGSIREIPSSFGQVRLNINDLGSDHAMVTFRIGSRTNSLPVCATKSIRTKSLENVRIVGSWYHDESILPYYVIAEFYDPGFNSNHWANSSYKFMFNLHTAQLMEVTRFEANSSGSGGKDKVVTFPGSCKVTRDRTGSAGSDRRVHVPRPP